MATVPAIERFLAPSQSSVVRRLCRRICRRPMIGVHQSIPPIWLRCASRTHRRRVANSCCRTCQGGPSHTIPFSRGEGGHRHASLPMSSCDDSLPANSLDQQAPVVNEDSLAAAMENQQHRSSATSVRACWGAAQRHDHEAQLALDLSATADTTSEKPRSLRANRIQLSWS